MSRPLWIAAVAVSLVVALGGLSTPASAQPVGNAVTEWNLIAANTLVQFPPPAGGAPPALQISMAMVQGAVYDAVNAIEPKHRRPYLLETRFPATASREAAAATAAYSVLSNIVTTVPASVSFPTSSDLLQTLDTEYETSLRQYRTDRPRRRGSPRGTLPPTR